MSTNIITESDSAETPDNQAEPVVQRLSKNGRNGRSLGAARSGNSVVRKASEKLKDSSPEMDAMRGQLEALNRSQAVIEFEMDGTVISANENFLSVMGYSLREIQGEHHQMFCDDEYSRTPEYRQFWKALRAGEFQSGEFKRIGKGGKEVWIMASYNPIFDSTGKPFKVVKFATDITASKAELHVRTQIMNLTSIVSESDLRGDILSVNEKFCEVSKYNREELIG